MLRVEFYNLEDLIELMDRVEDGLYDHVLGPALKEASLMSEFEAKNRVPVLIGVLKNSIHTEEPLDQKTRNRAVAMLVADAPYSGFVEMGFRPHFVPFHLSWELQEWARHQLGYRRCALPENRRFSGRVYMEDPEGHLHWGVPVSGRAQPFMQPAAVVAERALPVLIERRLAGYLHDLGYRP